MRSNAKRDVSGSGACDHDLADESANEGNSHSEQLLFPEVFVVPELR